MSKSIQKDSEPVKSFGVQANEVTEDGVASEGNQVGPSLFTPETEKSIGHKGYQYDVDNYNKSIQADEQPLKDMDVQ